MKRPLSRWLYYLPFSVFCLMMLFGGIFVYNLFAGVDASDLELGEAHPTDRHLSSPDKKKKEEITVPEFTDAQMKALEEARKKAEEEAKAKAEEAAKPKAEPVAEEPVEATPAEATQETHVETAPAQETPAAPVEPQIIDLTE